MSFYTALALSSLLFSSLISLFGNWILKELSFKMISSLIFPIIYLIVWYKEMPELETIFPGMEPEREKDILKYHFDELKRYAKKNFIF